MGQIFGFISFFLCRRRLQVVLYGKSSQEYSFNAGSPQGSILGPTYFVLYINSLPDDVICNITIYAEDTTLYSKCDQTFDLWQQLGLAAVLESDLGETVDGVGSGLFISMLEKLNLFCLTSLVALVLLEWKWMSLLLRKNHLLRCWGCVFLLNCIGALTLCFIAETASKKIGALIRSIKFLSP